MKELTILIAEDEKNLLVLLDRILKKQGCKTLTASDGTQALELMEQNKVDILITDIKMPGIDGLELLKRTKRIDPSIEVILMTAHATLDTAVNALRSGARDYILKPFDIEEIIQSVNKTALLIAQETAVSDTLDTQIEKTLVTKSQVMKNLVHLMRKVAGSSATVFIQGETGVGKELVAKAIHEISERRDHPFIKVNCSALPETLLESELFGYEKGAFTGAHVQKPGRFELANKGTIFLDEIGDISPLIQIKLLRVLQHKEFERLGGTETVPVDVRIITATNRDIEKLVAEGVFREDLYYRLNVIPIAVPALRERKEDIQDLTNSFIEAASNQNGIERKRFSAEAMDIMQVYSWPGNVRELENIVERLLIIAEGPVIEKEDLPEKVLDTGNMHVDSNLDAYRESAEEQIIRKALKETSNNITRTAEKLGISRRSLHRKLNKYDIDTHN